MVFKTNSKKLNKILFNSDYCFRYSKTVIIVEKKKLYFTTSSYYDPLVQQEKIVVISDKRTIYSIKIITIKYIFCTYKD